MKKNDDFDFDLDLGENPSTPKEKPFSFNDLDLGLDMDLSWLDDIDESAPAEAPKAAPVKAPPTKKPAPAQQPAAPAKKPAAPQQSKKPAVPQRPVNSQNPTNVQRPENGQRSAAQRPVGNQPGVNGQRPANSPRPTSAQRPANGQPGAAAKTPANRPAAPPQQTPAQQAPTNKKKSGPRLGGVIFYTLYFLFILIFFLGTFLALNFLHGWLTNYEMAQPGHKAEQVFTQLFTNPDWGALYDSAGAKDSLYEGKDSYVAYMEEKVGGSELTYLETSAGLSGDKKYLVRLGKEKVASFTLVDKAKNDDADMTNKLKNMSWIPDWQLGSVEVFFDRQETYYVVKLDGHSALVNDIPLSDDTIIQVATTLAEKYLPEGTTGASMCTQRVDGLMSLPVVTIFDKSGKQMEVTYDEATRTFTERLESNTMSEDQREAAIKAAETYCNWMLAVDNDRGHAAQILDPAGDAYKTLTSIPRDQLWVQSNNGFTYDNINVSDFALYAGDIFSVRVTLDVNVTRTDGSIKNYPFNSSMFFRKSDTGKWLCYNTTNVDVSEPVGRVRLTFMSGESEVHSQFYGTDSKEIVTPVVPTPEGKVFSGWATIEKGDNGAMVYNLQFQPDEEGKVVIPDGTILKPMTLYALFQNPDEQTVAPAPAAESADAEAPETEGA